MAEFAYNNGINTSTGKSPFQVCYGFNPRLNVHEDTSRNMPASDKHAEFLQKGYNKVKAALTLAQETYKKYYDANHKAEELINKGNQVWLNAQNMTTDHLTRKLAHKCFGPYKVVTKVGSHTYKLSLPQ